MTAIVRDPPLAQGAHRRCLADCRTNTRMPAFGLTSAWPWGTTARRSALHRNPAGKTNTESAISRQQCLPPTWSRPVEPESASERLQVLPKEIEARSTGFLTAGRVTPLGRTIRPESVNLLYPLFR